MPDSNELLICVARTMLLNVLRVTMTPVIGHPGRYDKSWTSMILPSTLWSSTFNDTQYDS